MHQERVAVAISGGVDSSVAAALLKQDGYEVIGFTHRIWPTSLQYCQEDSEGEIITSAQNVANKLNIPFHVLDLRTEFADEVISRFCKEYESGKTPNPCILCNKYIRFQILLQQVQDMGINYLATGHYARVQHTNTGYHLLKAIDASKDQSYFLYTLGQNELSHIIFPIGALLKSEVKHIAAKSGLPSFSRKESQDICFIKGDYREFAKNYFPLKPGDIVDTSGVTIGRHDGLALYTVGQRHGLGRLWSIPMYVLQLDPLNNRVIVGNREKLYQRRLTASNINWISGNPPENMTMVNARIRSRSQESPATIKFLDNRVEVEFNKPQMAITPGQSIVFYQREEVLGGGIIEGTVPDNVTVN